MGVIEAETLFTRKPADRQGFRDKLFGDWFQPAVKCPVQGGFNDDGSETNHRIVARYGPVGLDINHDVWHFVRLPGLVLVALVVVGLVVVGLVVVSGSS